MSHLLAIAVGPVQEFIAAARRTRDLWLGSYLLSEISRAVAKSVEDNGGALIFPASAGADSIANVIVAELNADDPENVAAKAKIAAQHKWNEITNGVLQEVSEFIRSEIIWKEQAKDVIEYYAAWVARSDNYKADRKKVMRLLAGRKNCRNFLPARGHAGVPKSSLDGQRESVLKSPSESPRQSSSQLRLRSGEQLDVVGVVKRAAEGNRPYPSVARIAADPWVRGNKDRLKSVTDACKKLGDKVIRPLDSSYEQYAQFAYEGTAVYLSRHHELLEEVMTDSLKLQVLQDALSKLPEPCPYLAVLVADGDRMGEKISEQNNPNEHRKFSKRLADFASNVKSIVTKHYGVLVYAGGDDVLAFLPVDKCLACARELHDDFGKRLADYGTPTLSVGIAIGHFMENLEDLLEYGRDAERAAKKPDRDGLAVRVHKRGGVPVQVRAQWKDKLYERLEKFAELINDGAIPSKLPYELQSMSRLYESWSSSDDVNKAIQQDLNRLIDKKVSRGSKSVREELSEYITDMNAGKLSKLSKELLVARLIAEAFRQAHTTQGVTP